MAACEPVHADITLATYLKYFIKYLPKCQTESNLGGEGAGKENGIDITGRKYRQGLVRETRYLGEGVVLRKQ